MIAAAEELKALREEVAALRKEVEALKDRVIPNVNIGAPAYPAYPAQPLPMPPYRYQPHSSDASGVWRYPESAGGTRV